MSYVKSLYGNIVGENLNLKEGQVGFTDYDHHFKELEKRGIVKLFATYEEADAFKFVSSIELFNKSYKTLNPPEGEVPPPSLVDFANGGPIVTDGVPSNYIKEEVKSAPVPEVKKAEKPKASDPLTPAADAETK